MKLYVSKFVDSFKLYDGRMLKYDSNFLNGIQDSLNYFRNFRASDLGFLLHET